MFNKNIINFIDNKINENKFSFLGIMYNNAKTD